MPIKKTIGLIKKYGVWMPLVVLAHGVVRFISNMIDPKNVKESIKNDGQKYIFYIFITSKRNMWPFIPGETIYFFRANMSEGMTVFLQQSTVSMSCMIGN